MKIKQRKRKRPVITLRERLERRGPKRDYTGNSKFPEFKDMRERIEESESKL